MVLVIIETYFINWMKQNTIRCTIQINDAVFFFVYALVWKLGKFC